MSDEAKVAIMACAGMEKTLGSVAMLSVLRVAEELRPGKTMVIALPPLLLGVGKLADQVKRLPVIVVDGCGERCSMKCTAKIGGRIRGRILVLDSAKKYGLRPDAPFKEGSEGHRLAEKIAEEAASLVDKILEGQEK